MGLEKAIKYGKEHRKNYTGCKSYDKACINHGNCKYCRENRLISTRRREQKASYDIYI